MNPGDGPTELEVTLEGVATGRLEPVLSTEPDGAAPSPTVFADSRARVAIPGRSAIAFRVAVDAT